MTSPKPLNSKHGRCNQVFLFKIYRWVEKFRFNQDWQMFELLSINICICSVLSFHWVYLSIHPSISLSIYPVISFIIYFNIDSLTTQGTWRHFCCHLKIKNINFPRRFWTLDCLDKFELPWCSIHRGIFNGINLH